MTHPDIVKRLENAALEYDNDLIAGNLFQEVHTALVCDRKRIGELEVALRWIAAFKTGSPHRPGQIKSEHRAMIERARAILKDTPDADPS